MEIDTLIRDTADSEKGNIHYAKENKLQLVSKLKSVITDGTRPKEKQFEFNKDADLFIYPASHLATQRHKDQETFQNTEKLKKSHHKIEAKNSELKHRHGYDVASSAGSIRYEHARSDGYIRCHSQTNS